MGAVPSRSTRSLDVMQSSEDKSITDETIADLEAEIVAALVERLPELKPFSVMPEAVTYLERGVPLEAWAIARSRAAVLFIGVEPERFGVGFVNDGHELENVSLYPTPEIAVPAFIAAGKYA